MKHFRNNRPAPKFVARPLAALIFSFLTLHAAAQHDDVAAASKLAAEGRHAAAEAAYDKVLGADAANIAARIGRAYTRAWQKNYVGAEADFRAALAREPGNLAARNGLAYTLAWAGRHGEAEAEFKGVLAASPNDFDAAKGLAYVALWRGDAATAATRFRALTESRPDDAEMQVGLGRAQAAAGDRGAARAAFERALALEPGRADAREGLDALSQPHGFRRSYSISALYGHTRFGEGLSESGLRFAEAAMQVTPQLRVWLQYDDGLARDNVDFVRRNVNADAYYVGGVLSYGGRHATRLDLGRRKLDQGVHQNVVRVEQTLRLDGGMIPKLGVWLGDSSNARAEYTVNAGLSIPVIARLRVEPMVFYSENGARERELRGLLFGEYSFAGGANLGVGVSDGRKFNSATSNARHEIFLTGGLPLWDGIRLNLLARRDSGAGAPPTELIALGLSYSF